MEKIVDVLARKYPQFNTVIPDCFVSDALYQMRCENVDYLIVLEEDKFQGVISDHEIAGRILFEDRPLNKIQVKEFMSRTLPVATPEATVAQCLKLMDRHHVHHLAIYDQFDFRGVISSSELVHEALAYDDLSFQEVEPKRQGYPWNY
jgi:CBS domain-containing protein